MKLGGQAYRVDVDAPRPRPPTTLRSASVTKFNLGRLRRLADRRAEQTDEGYPPPLQPRPSLEPVLATVVEPSNELDVVRSEGIKDVDEAKIGRPQGNDAEAIVTDVLSGPESFVAPTQADSVVETLTHGQEVRVEMNWGRFHHIGERPCQILGTSPWLHPSWEQTSPSVDIEIILGMRRREAEPPEQAEDEAEAHDDEASADFVSELEEDSVTDMSTRSMGDIDIAPSCRATV